MVVDNTNWYAAVTFNQSKEAGAASKKDVAFNLKVTNNFEANKGFQFLFAGFLAILGVLILTLIITCGCLCYQKKVYGELMETKAEIKKREQQKKQNALREELRAQRTRNMLFDD